MNRLTGKVAVITGAASGMGKAIALLFISEGCKVVASDINRSRLEELQEHATESGGEIITFESDITRQEEIDLLIDTSVKEYETLDILVNCAGVMDNFEAAGDLSDEVYEKVMKINAEGSFRTISKALSGFAES